jgi:hypothetical protein
MSVVVSFIAPQGMGTVNAPGIGACRVKEVITVPGTTTAAALAGEVVLICNGENSTVLAANGTAPDAQAGASAAATSAGYPIPVGCIVPVVPKAGDKINIKTVG